MEEKGVLYNKETIEFARVAVDFYKLIHAVNQMTEEDFVGKSVKILPLLYVTTLSLPELSLLSEEIHEQFVTEQAYEMVKVNIANKLGEHDDYLEVFHPDMPYSDTPILANISEDLADIYQDIANFISLFQTEQAKVMNDALFICKENFYEFWGQKLLNSLRALHAIMKMKTV